MDRQRQLDLSALVREQLEMLIDEEPTDSLLNTYDQFERGLEYCVRLVFLAEIELFARKNRKSFENYFHHFNYGKGIYELRVASPPTSPDTLVIFNRATDPSISSLETTPIVAQVNSVGRYRELRLCTERTFLPRAEYIVEAGKVILESGYRWIAGHVGRSILEMHHEDAAGEIYRWIRRLLPERVANRVWPYSIVDGEGIYTMDPVAQKTALDHLANRELNTGLSPVDLLIIFSTTRLPREKTFTDIALSQNTTIKRDFVKAQYAASNLHLAEQATYLSRSHAIQPIVRAGKTQLAVGYPLDLVQYVEPFLQQGREEITRIIEAQSSTLRQTIENLKDQDQIPRISTAGQIGAYLGDFTAEFTKHFTEHYFHFG